MEGIWDTGPGQSAVLFAIPDSAAEKNHADRDSETRELHLTHDWNGVVKGLKDFPREDRRRSFRVLWLPG